MQEIESTKLYKIVLTLFEQSDILKSVIITNIEKEINRKGEINYEKICMYRMWLCS